MSGDGARGGGGASGAGRQPAILQPGTLWARAVEQHRVEARKPGGESSQRPDSYLFLVGAPGAGKSTLLQRLLHPDKRDRTKPTEGLEYTFARKSAAANLDRKDVAHIWEIGGGEQLGTTVAGSDSLFLNYRQVTTATVVICVNLARPSEVLETIMHWLRLIRGRLSKCYDMLSKRGSKLPHQLRARNKKPYGSGHEDLPLIERQMTGVSIVLCATHYDQFENEDAELRKVMGRTLRFIAHTQGCHLVYTGCGPNHGAMERQTVANFRAIVQHLIFTGPDRRVPLKQPPTFDHARALMVPLGYDRLRDIGRPRGSTEETLESGLRDWEAMFSGTFPKPPAADKGAAKVDLAPYPEKDVDGLYARKLKEMADYKLQVQQQMDALRMARAKKAAGMRA